MLKVNRELDEVQRVREFEVVEYMDNMDGEHHSALAQGPMCDSLTGHWIIPPDNKDLKEVYAECREAQQNLTARINKYLEKAKQPPLQLQGNGDWDGVKCQVEKACVTMEAVLATKKKKGGFIATLRRGYSTLCRNAGTGKALVSLIPDDLMIASAISGGLNMIFTALEEHGMYEESVFKSLETLPEILNANERYSEIAVNNREIHRQTARLYARVCEALEFILRWMMDNVLISGAKQLFQPKRYAKDLNDKMAEVKLTAQKLEKWANIALLESQKDQMKLQSGMYFGQAQLSRDVKGLHEKFDRLTSKIDRATELERMGPVIFNNIQPVLNDEWTCQFLITKRYAVETITVSPRNDRFKTARKHSEYQIALKLPVISAETVLCELMHEPDLVPRDIDDILRQGTMPLHRRLQPRRVTAIQENPRVQAWLTLDESSILLVNGNAASHVDLSTSFFSARIVRSLMENASQYRESLEIVPLAYFCGQHQNYTRDAAASPSELAMSLLLQLVDRHREFDAADLQRCLDDIDPQNIGSIFESLGTLLGHLSSRSFVYLIVDGVEHFARPDLRRADFQDVLVKLVDLFQRQKRAKLKILLTCAQRGVLLEDLNLLADDEIVNIPMSPPPANPLNLSRQPSQEETIATRDSGFVG